MLCLLWPYARAGGQVAFIVACLSAGIANAYLIGGVVSLLERMNERKSEFYRAMDILNEFLKERDLSSVRARRLFHSAETGRRG